MTPEEHPRPDAGAGASPRGRGRHLPETAGRLRRPGAARSRRRPPPRRRARDAPGRVRRLRRGRRPTSVAADEDTAASDELTLAQTALAERTLDLQRLQAEFLNYKRRVDRDRELVRQNATFAVLSELLPVLDDIDRAREHGELEGGFKAVADSLERIVSGAGADEVRRQGRRVRPQPPRGADARPLAGGHDHHGRRGGPRRLPHR